jgi:hypothetical protein
MYLSDLTLFCFYDVVVCNLQRGDLIDRKGEGCFSQLKHEGETHYGVSGLSQVTNHGCTETLSTSSAASCKLFVAELFLGGG